MRAAGEATYGLRTRALVVVLWRAGVRISEALALAESDLDRSRGSVLVRHGKGGKRRQVGMHRWAWDRSTRGCAPACRFPSARCCASSTPHPGTAVVTRGRPCHLAPLRRARGRSPAIRPGSATRTSASRPSTYKGSTTARSSNPLVPARRRCSRRAPACAEVLAQSGSEKRAAESLLRRASLDSALRPAALVPAQK